MMRSFWVYILASRSRVLYIGVTNNLEQRLAAHRSKSDPNSFTAKYNVTRLVYAEEHDGPSDAIARETKLKKWRREKKLRLIETLNPEWRDLAPPANERDV